MLSNGVAYSTFDRNIISVCFEVFHDKSFLEGGVSEGSSNDYYERGKLVMGWGKINEHLMPIVASVCVCV